MNIHQVFQYGAQKLAREEARYTDLHKSHGIEQAHWELLTQKEYWTPDQARSIRSILANVVEISMTIAGMPAIPLPGQYVAAVIAEVVAPCNRMVACTKVPDTFNAADASGLMESVEVKPMTQQQIMALVLAYSGGNKIEPHNSEVPSDINEAVSQMNQSDKVTKK